MSTARILHRGHKRLKPLIDFALMEGWEVARTPGGHLFFNDPATTEIYTGATASDHRAGRNALARLRRAARALGLHSAIGRTGGDG